MSAARPGANGASSTMERLFSRQLARARDTGGNLDITVLQHLVCKSYEDSDRDRRRIDRAMALMGEELQAANDCLAATARQLAIQARQFEAALQNMSHGIIMYDAEERIVVLNDRLFDMTNLPPGSLRLGMTLREALAVRQAHGHFPGCSPEDLYRERSALLFHGGPMEREEQVGDRVLMMSASPLPEGGCVVLVQDVTERRAAEARIAHLSRHDVLTGLPNRSHLLAKLDEALHRLSRGSRFALLCLDLDQFKQVNDTLGHPVGDKLLQQVTQRLLAELRETDLVARLGGDEFAIIQESADQPQSVTALANRLVRSMAEPFLVDGHRMVIGTSIGIAMAPDDSASADILLKSADLALYRAKSEGRGAWRFFEPEMNARMQRRRLLELDLRAGIQEHQFEMFYQPLVQAETGRLNGFEALLRWRHPERGLVSPAEFIPLAEETGLIIPLGEFVLEQSCAAAATWPPPLNVAVNVSAVQFRQPTFVEVVARALAASGLDPARLELEVTETIMLQDNVATVAQLHRLRRLGVRIAMDDFGTGYSSLSYLRSFPFDKIKIDQSFIREIGNSGEAQAIVRAIAGLGATLGMRTTAEGVETSEQLERVRAIGCTDVQGFIFGRPVPQAELTSYLAAADERDPLQGTEAFTGR